MNPLLVLRRTSVRAFVKSLQTLGTWVGTGATAAMLTLGCSGSESDDKSAAVTESPLCSVSGHACTWLGQAGSEGFNGDGHHRLSTKLYWTMDMLFDSAGTAWFIDWNNHLLRRVTPNDTVETVVGWTDPVFPGDGTPNNLERSETGAAGTDVQLNHPTDLTELPDGTILLMAWHNHKLRALDPQSGRVKILGGGGAGFAGDGGPLAKALFKQPKALQLDDKGNLYVLDQQNFRIRRIDSAGVITTVIGTGMQGSDGDDGPAAKATLDFEAGSNPEPSGGLAFRDGKLYFSDTLANRIRVVDLETGMMEAFAGTGDRGYSGDGGAALEASLNRPRDLEFGPDGNLYVADTDNSVVRAIDLETQLIRTVVGTGVAGLDAEEGALATATSLKRPFGIEFDAAGNLYVSDTINSRIVRVAH